MKKIYFFIVFFIFFSLFSFAQTYTYNFNGNLNESSSGPALTELTSCGAAPGSFTSQIINTTVGNCNSLPQTVFAFNPGGGLAFPNSSVIGGTYTIHIFWKFNALGGYQRIIDFLDGSTDVGLYTLNDCLNFYPNGNVGACPYFVANNFYLLTLVRDGATNLITVYVNGTSFGTYNDAANTYVPATSTSPIVFFRDNIASSAQCEDRDGSIKYLSISPAVSTAAQVNTVWTNICSIALPVTLTSFAGTKTDRGIMLNWNTQNEINTSRYEVERSGDAKNYSVIGAVAANNRVGGSSYSYNDVQTLPATNYYRLKIFDLNGTYRYSTVLRLSYTKGVGMQLYPNPATNIVMISGVSQNQNIRLLTAQGLLLKHMVSAGETMTLSLADYPAGIYIVEYQEANKIERQKLVKY